MSNLWKIHKEKGVMPMSPHLDTKQKLKKIDTITNFEELLLISVLSDEEKTILRMYYLKEQDFGFIADTLGSSKATIYKKHTKALRKLRRLV